MDTVSVAAGKATIIDGLGSEVGCPRCHKREGSVSLFRNQRLWVSWQERARGIYKYTENHHL